MFDPFTVKTIVTTEFQFEILIYYVLLIDLNTYIYIYKFVIFSFIFGRVQYFLNRVSYGKRLTQLSIKKKIIWDNRAPHQ